MASAVEHSESEAPVPSVQMNTIGTWQADSVSAGQVEAALSDLRRHEERAAVRTSVLTLVIVVSSVDEAQEHLDVVRHLGARHPSRTLVLPFTLPDLPVAVWLPDSLPSRGDPLLEAADRVVVDTRVVGYQPDALSRLHSLTHRVAVTDLSWSRLKPWRNLFGGLFEGEVYRPFLRDVHHLEVTGHAGPRHLFAGWVMSRLQLPRALVHLGDAEHLSVKLVATHEGRRGRFEVERKGDERVIDASVEIDGGPAFQQKVQIGEAWPSRSLADALAHMGHNQTYEAALEAALGLLR